MIRVVKVLHTASKANNHRILLVGLRPPPITGQSAAFETVINLLQKTKATITVVDLSDTLHRSSGDFSWRRALQIMAGIICYLQHVWPFGQTVYLNVGFSVLGFIRDFIFIWLAVLMRHRIILHVHGGGYDALWRSKPAWFRSVVFATLSRAHCIIVLGHYLQEQFSSLGTPQRKLNIAVIHNCLPNQLLSAPQPKIRNKADVLRILYLSNLIESKGYWDVLNAVCLLIEKGYKVRVDFCGAFKNSPDDTNFTTVQAAQAAFYKKISDPTLAGSITFHGVVEGKQKEDLLKNSDIFVLPTYYIYEGQPISIIEAMAHALPIITTDYRGIPEMVCHGRNGFLVPPCSPTEIADKLMVMMNSPELYNAMSEASLTMYHAHFSTEHFTTKILHVLLTDKLDTETMLN